MDRQKIRNKIHEDIEKKLLNTNLNDLNTALLGIVRDRPDGTIFYEYEPREEIGQYICAELLDKYDEELGFVLSDDVREAGVLTQAQGACSLNSLLVDYNVLSGLDNEDAAMIRNIYKKTLYRILDMISGDGKEYVFNATPYNVDAFDREYAYTDSITWVISALLGALQMDESGVGAEAGTIEWFSTDERKKFAEVIAYCVEYLVNSYIDISDKNEKKLSRGWGFTKGCSEPSLYFTYAVSECYLDIYDAFKHVIDKHNIGIKIDQIKNSQEYNITSEDEVYMYLSVEDKLSYENINEQSEQFVIEQVFFDIISGNDNYYRLEEQVKQSAQNAWSLVKDGIDNGFYNSNLSGIIDPLTIESSSSSDALFNNLFVINNVITGAIDEEISDRLARATDDELMNRIQGEYDALLETLQAALQRVVRYNKIMQTKQKEYIVNDYVISCNERYEGEINKKSQELRKKRIKTLTLSPLIVKTNNLISEFLTKYPQYDMIKYLDELLMKNRTMDEAGDYLWIWENGEYQITSNYYYILSISSFYRYIDTYESRFSKIDYENEKLRTSILSEQLDELRNHGEIFKLTNQNKELLDDNDRLNERIAELESRESEVERALKELLREEVRENLVIWISEGVTKISEEVYAHLLDRDFAETHVKELSFMDAIKNAVVLAFSDVYKEQLLYLGGCEPGQIAKQMKRKLDTTVRNQVKTIVETPENDQQ